jgi:hypothetical protein
MVDGVDISVISKYRRIVMKTLIVLITATVAVVGASQAMAADVQASDEAVNNALSHRAGWSYGGAYDSARPGETRNSTFATPRSYDFQGGD